MSQSLIFWHDCWIYLNKKERENLRFIVSYLKNRKSVCLSELERKSPNSKQSIRNAMLYLLAGRVVNVKQHRSVRVYSMRPDWIIKLKKLTTPYKLVSITRNPSYNKAQVIEETEQHEEDI